MVLTKRDDSALKVSLVVPMWILFIFGGMQGGHAAPTEILAPNAFSGVSALPPPDGDIVSGFSAPTSTDNYIVREVMIPMRDSVRLYTVIVIPRGVSGAPILLTRTPYNAEKRGMRALSASVQARLPQGDEEFANAGYIRVYQDVRGKHKSEGKFVMTQPRRGLLNNGSTDETTDAWDTIEWLVRNTPESNGRVGMIGTSYDGFTVVMALLDPHPALKVAAPESPMIDGWMGDDWFHYGAFRQVNLDYFLFMTAAKGEGDPAKRSTYDDFEAFLRAGSAGDYARLVGVDRLPFWQRVTAHPTYDTFWREQALDHVLSKQKLSVPTMWVQGLWDQEDMWGAVHCYLAQKKLAVSDQLNHLVMGPWRHSQVNYDGYSLGPLRFEGDTARQFRRDVLVPFFNQYLKNAPSSNTPPVYVYNTGNQRWDRLSTWPAACAEGCATPLRPIYLHAGFSLSFEPPRERQSASDSYVSDPAKPVPYAPRPVHFMNADSWRRWLVEDQRVYSDRPDVLTYETPPLTEPVAISGAPLADLYASTTGTDADWVVKLIDVYPGEVPAQPELGGYQLGIAMDIFRGRYRKDFSRPSPILSNTVERYRFELPPTNHIFQRGHRIMVQIQSSWFPLYDRNPQKYVDNIFFAQPDAYVRATQTIVRSPAAASAIWLPVVGD